MGSRYTKERLMSPIAQSYSWAGVCRLLGITAATGAQSHIKKRAIEFGIDFSHFTGQAWTRGKVACNRKPIEDFLVLGSTAKTHSLKLRLIKEGIKLPECENCGIREWLGEPVVLHMDHINSNPTDFRLENLKILCPNCHAAKTRKYKKKNGP